MEDDISCDAASFSSANIAALALILVLTLLVGCVAFLGLVDALVYVFLFFVA